MFVSVLTFIAFYARYDIAKIHFLLRFNKTVLKFFFLLKRQLGLHARSFYSTEISPCTPYYTRLLAIRLRPRSPIYHLEQLELWAVRGQRQRKGHRWKNLELHSWERRLPEG